MIPVIVGLLNRDTSFVEQFGDAKEFWDQFFAQHRGDTVEELAQALGSAQFRVERVFGDDRYLGKSLMPYTALGSLYDETNGFGDNHDFATRLVKAFERSSVSLEVKHAAPRAAALFHLD